jgi:hypothetical protein
LEALVDITQKIHLLGVEDHLVAPKHSKLEELKLQNHSSKGNSNKESKWQ